MKPLYLIPARGGSKGLPGKNIRLLAGKPLIAHSIAHALAVADDASQVVVSTDSAYIASAAHDAKARIPFMRPAELATDTAGSREVIIHAIDTLATLGEHYDCIVLLQPTSPLRDPEDISRALDIFKKERPDMVVSVKAAHTNPYYNAFECNAEGFLRISKGDGLITRRQDAPEVWEFDGSIYVIDPNALRTYPSLARMEKIIPLPVKESVDIDTEADFLQAEQMLESKNNNKN